MRICIIHQYYKTPKTGGAIRSYYIANYLSTQLGHEVVVITARNNKAYSIDKTDGYEVHYLPVYYENHLSFYSRVHAFVLFAWKAYRLLKKLPKPDINYVITTPLTTGFIATRAKIKLGIPYVFEVGDLWPDAPIELGIIKNPLLKNITIRWEQKFYQKAKAIIALSTDLKDRILKKCPQKQIHVVTNFADSALFKPTNKSQALEETYKTEGHFVIAYLGTLGIANHLQYLIEAAKAVKDLKVKFIVAGGGAKYDSIKESAQQDELTNITFYQHRSKYELNELMNISDAVYISFKNVPVLATGSPNKFFDGLAAGKLIIINFEGWIKELIEKEKCGFYYPPLQPELFKQAIESYINSPEELKAAQLNANRIADYFSPVNQLKTLKDIFE